MTVVDEDPPQTWEAKLQRLLATPRPELVLEFITDPSAREAVDAAAASLQAAGRDAALAGENADVRVRVDAALQAAEGAHEVAVGALRAATVCIRFRAVPAWAWEQLKAAHPGPPKSGLLFNMRTLMPAAIAASMAEADVTLEQVEVLFGYLHAEQLERVFAAVWELNTGRSVSSG